MQRSWHEFPSNGIAVGAKLKKIFHNLASVVDCSPVEQRDILLEETDDDDGDSDRVMMMMMMMVMMLMIRWWWLGNDD